MRKCERQAKFTRAVDHADGFAWMGDGESGCDVHTFLGKGLELDAVQAGRFDWGQKLLGCIAIACRPEYPFDQDMVTPWMGAPQIAGKGDSLPVDVPDRCVVEPELRPPAAIGAPSRRAHHKAPTRCLGQVEIRNRVAPQHIAPLWAVEQDEGGEQGHFGAFVEDQVCLHSPSLMNGSGDENRRSIIPMVSSPE